MTRRLERAAALLRNTDRSVMDAETGDQVRSLMARGFAGSVFLTTDDIDGDYERLTKAGVEFASAPNDVVSVSAGARRAPRR